jgi:hypothetical protein
VLTNLRSNLVRKSSRFCIEGFLYIFPTPLYTRVSCGRASISAVDSSSMRFLRVCDCICWRTRTSCCSANCALLWISCRSCWSFSLGIDIVCGCCLVFLACSVSVWCIYSRTTKLPHKHRTGLLSSITCHTKRGMERLCGSIRAVGQGEHDACNVDRRTEVWTRACAGC